jgi:hypothetical protein
MHDLYVQCVSTQTGSSEWHFVSRTPPANQSHPSITSVSMHPAFDSSVGRAVDCSCSMSDIHRSLVQIRLEGVFAVLMQNDRLDLKFVLSTYHQFLDSLVVRISACHVEGPGSIPGRGGFLLRFHSLALKHQRAAKCLAPGEARTHNPGISLCTVYKYRALTDCATGANW